MTTYLSGERIQGSSTADGALGSGLKAYYKFDESTGNIVNVASTITGNSTIGTGANIVFAGTGTTTYEVTGTPTNLGNAVTLPQTTTTSGIYGTFGDSTTDFDFMWSGTPQWTMCFWAKQSASAVSNTTLIKNNNGEGTKGFEIYWYGTSTVNLRFNMTNGSSGNPTGRPFNAADFTDFSTDGDWHFYSYVMDGSLGSNQLKVTRDGGTTQNFSKTAGGFSASGTSYSKMTLRTTYSSIGSYVPPEQSFCELMIFDTVLTDAQLTRIYNAGAGRLLSNAGTTDEKTTVTDVPVGTRYEETDTRKIFRRKGESTVGVAPPSGLGDKCWDMTEDDTILRLTTAQLIPNSSFTYSVWLYVTNTSQEQGFLKHGTGSIYASWISYNGSITGGELAFYVRNGSGTSSTKTNNSCFTANKWNLATFTFTTSAIKIYVNGTLNYDSSWGNQTGATGVNTLTDWVILCASATGTAEAFDGYAMDAAIWNEELSSTQVESLWNSYNNVTNVGGALATTILPNSLVAYWSGTGGDLSTIPNEATGTDTLGTNANWTTVTDISEGGTSPASWTEKGTA